MEVFKKIIVARINLPDHGVLKFLWYSCLHKYNFDASVVQITNNTELKWWHCRQRIRLPMVMTELVLSFSCDVLSITVYEIILWDKQWSLLNLVGKLPKNMEYFVINSIIHMQYCFAWTQDTVQHYADTQRSCEDRVDSYSILLQVDSAIQFILILNELLRIQFNFMLTPKGAVRIDLFLLCFSYSKFNVYNFYHYKIMLFSYCKQLSILSVCESVYLWDGLCVLKDMCRG